ncbi:FAD-binding oxidoreductase [Sphingomonas radiodurans]|uniref:FAD-binding oxidoreductase n=1 Tax=Sphingomonas radiodurans TaxID=2890321 RepID=UPI001E39AF38|nr:FAD-binding oxidoreductase [Sphingomonas radiodurans]WBH18016.1 FAD-binding oxidoreductase [Sphingomonas radiodurans]
MATRLSEPTAIDTVAAAVGADLIVTDERERALYGQDIFSVGRPPAGIFRPRDIETLSRGIAAAAAAGLTIVPRGGGMSYTSGYLPAEAGALVIDVSGMDRILSVNADDMTVTVEAGCTWAKLYETLHPLGLRPPVWGTLSGLIANVGGGMSQSGVFWGAARGPIVSSALSFDVVLADGRIVRTGNPGMRPFGPDVTGIFAGDCGAFGIKAQITLPLIREAKALAYGSYAFDDAAAFIGATSEIARAGLATEIFGFDPFLQAQRMKRESLAKDAKALVGVMKSQGGFWKGLKEGAKIVAAGRSFLDEAGFSVHTICEGRNQAAADADLEAINAIVKAAGGRPVENTIPKVMRANPFPNVNSMVGPQGERWVPTHGVLRHSKALPTLNAIIALYEKHREAMERLDIGAGYLFLTMGTTSFLIEPVFFWPDQLEQAHERAIEPGHFAKLTRFPVNPEGRALVETLRAGLMEIFGEVEAGHFQIGRSYPLKARSDPGAWDVLEAVKRAVDPDHRMNPGSLGL